MLINYKEHPLNMSSTSLKQYIDMLKRESNGNIISWIHEAFMRIAELSSIIKVHKHTKIQKSHFYAIKSMFTYFMYTLCTPNDGNYFEEFKVSPKNINVTSHGKIYELEFIIDGVSHIISAKHNSDVMYNNYLEEYFKDFIIPENASYYEIKDYSNLSDEDIFKIYQDFIDWCVEHEWFFTVFYNDKHVFEHLKKVYKNTKYAIHYAPNDSAIFKMCGQPKFYAYKINPNTLEFICTSNRVRNVRNVFTSIEKESEEFTDIVNACNTGPTYSLYYEPYYTNHIYDIKQFKEEIYRNLPNVIAESLCNMVNYVHRVNPKITGLIAKRQK